MTPSRSLRARAGRSAGAVRSAGTCAALGVALAAAPAAQACRACFGAEDSPLIHGAKLGAVALIFITALVQIAFIAFFIHLRRRARIAAALEASSPWAEAPIDPR